MTTNLPSVSIIVVGYNSRHHLARCFGALLRQEYPGRVELLFVDNASTDGSAAYVHTRFPGVRVVAAGGNLGYAGGNNLGAGHASGEVLAFINPDTEAEPTWLRELVRPVAIDPQVGLTTSKIVLMDRPALINTCGNEISLAGITTCTDAGSPAATVTRDRDVSAVSGAACAIRADLFRRLGGFDARFWMYLEDTDLSWRVRLAGYRCVLAACSVVAHDYCMSLTSAKTRLVERNRYLMLAKNLSGWALLAMIPSLLVGEVMTWGWAVSRGPRHTWSKLLAVLWVMAHLRLLWSAHRATQPLRRVPDAVLLGQHAPAPPMSEIVTGIAGRIAAAVLAPLALISAALALALLAVEPPEPLVAAVEHATPGSGAAD